MREVKQKHGGMLKIPEKGETNNPNGRPKKSFTKLNDLLKKEGYEPLTKKALTDAYALILSLDETKITEIAEDQEQPLAIRLIISEMVEPQTRGKTISDIRDYLFGRATQEVKSNVTIVEQPLFPE